MRAIFLVTLTVAYAAAAGAQAMAPAAPSITTAAALNGAQIVSISGGAPGATLYYTIDGAVPTAQSSRYFAPFLVASALTVKAVAVADGKPGAVSTQKFDIAIPPALCCGATSSTMQLTSVRSPIPKSGPTTPATPASAIGSSSTTVPRATRRHPAIPKIRMHSLPPMATSTSSPASPSPASTPRRASKARDSSASPMEPAASASKPA